MNQIRQFLSQLRNEYEYKNYRFPMNADNGKIGKEFIFIIGASGSGTTMLTRILSAPEKVVGLGGNFDGIPKANRKASQLGRLFREGTKNLWDRRANFEEHDKAKRALHSIVADLFALDIFNSATHILHKRSAPFGIGDRYRPDMLDLFDLFADPKIIVVYRDPKSSTYSSLRRGFSNNLRQSAVICEEQLTYLCAQIRSLNKESYMLLNYETFCERSIEFIMDVASFCKLDEGVLRRATLNENVTPVQIDRWRHSLPEKDIQFLDSFFSEKRQAQWAGLLG